MKMKDWPNCSTPDCGNKVCLWASLTKCYKCCERIYGTEFMKDLYNITHEGGRLNPEIEGIDG
jgi:hypothetical protein